MTIDDLMRGKVPGSVKVTRKESHDIYLVPYFKAANGQWICQNEDGWRRDVDNFDDFEIYTEPKPTKRVYEWMVRRKENWELFERLMTEEEASDCFTQNLGGVMPHRKTGRSFEVEA